MNIQLSDLHRENAILRNALQAMVKVDKGCHQWTLHQAQQALDNHVTLQYELKDSIHFRHIITFLKNSQLRLSAAWLIRRLFAVSIREAIDYVDGCHVMRRCGDFVLEENRGVLGVNDSNG